jgi:hypothetical protein
MGMSLYPVLVWVWGVEYGRVKLNLVRKTGPAMRGVALKALYPPGTLLSQMRNPVEASL